MDQNIKIEITLSQLNIVLAALSKQPLEVVLDTFNTIRKQAEEQVTTNNVPSTKE